MLDVWRITALELTEIVKANPSLRGMIQGYIGEFKLAQLLSTSARVTESFKHDDHDRSKKGDRVITYKDRRFVLESKSLQTNSVKRTEKHWAGTVQVDASDKSVFKKAVERYRDVSRVGEAGKVRRSRTALGVEWPRSGESRHGTEAVPK